MSGQIISIRAIALAVPLLILGIGIAVPANTAHADECLTSPKSTAPKGSHWYYHVDRAKHRKCWFLRALDPSTQATAAKDTSSTADDDAAKKAATAAADTAASTSASVKAPPLPPVRPQSAPTRTATTDEPVRQSVQNESATPPKPEAAAPQTSASSQPGIQAAAAAFAAATVWSDPPAIGTVEPQKPNLVESKARPDIVAPTPAHVPATADARPSDVSEGAARDDAPTIRTAKAAASPAGPLAQILIVVTLGLIVGGLLFRLVMKISAGRSRPIDIDQAEFAWIGGRPQHQLAYQREAFIEDSHLSLVPAVDDYAPRRLLRAVDTRRTNVRRNGEVAPVADAASDHENNLAQLIRDIDQLLQPRKGA